MERSENGGGRSRKGVVRIEGGKEKKEKKRKRREKR